MTKSIPLCELIRMTGNGDQAAFSELYEQMRQPVYRHILQKYGSVLCEEDAEDIVHNTFIIIASSARQFRGWNNDFSARSWILTIARSQASRIVKRKKRITISMDDDSDDNSAAPERNSLWSDIHWEGEDSVEERAIKKSFLRRIASSGSLSDEEKELIELRYEKGYTFEQIGRHYGRTKPRAKQKHDSIINKIRKALGLDSDEK